MGNCASVIYFMTVGIRGVKFEHDRLNHSQVPWKFRNLCRRILFFLRNSLVAQNALESNVLDYHYEIHIFAILIQQSFVIVARSLNHKDLALDTVISKFYLSDTKNVTYNIIAKFYVNFEYFNGII